MAKGDEGYFIEPTLVETKIPDYRLMCEEIFGPVVTAHVYDDAKWDGDARRSIDTTSPYALTGAVFAHDRAAVREAMTALRNAAGNFYVNDKPTGAVVGQQPFGGARASGTNDKAGLEAESGALGQRADDQGNLRAAARLSLSVHGGEVVQAPKRARSSALGPTRAGERDARPYTAHAVCSSPIRVRRAGGTVRSGAEAALPGGVGNTALVRGGQSHPEPRHNEARSRRVTLRPAETIGSARLARRAGMYDAARPIMHIATTTPPSVSGSPGDTP